jgi:DNA-binding NtrC family response regulator
MEPKRILWIGTQPPVLSSAAPPFRVEYRGSWAAGSSPYDRPAAVVLDFPIADWRRDDLLREMQRTAPGVPVLIRDAQATVSDAVRLTHQGAHQFLLEDEDPVRAIEQAIEDRTTYGLARLANQVGGEDWERMLVGESREMRRVHYLIRMVGSRRATVLITGETGTGKEIAARALHLAGPRRRAALVAVNCSALPENLLEAELFGHVRGAFTGAIQNRTGRFEQAQGGTLFLDEIGELPMDVQVKLLRVLQEREFQKLGSSETIRADVRVVAATNCDLARKIREGRFREDLYYRLNVVPIEMPPLRRRQGDIALLAVHFVEKICRIEEIPVKRIGDDALTHLARLEWPGNVRQLENAIEMAVALSGDRMVLCSADFPQHHEESGSRMPEPIGPAIALPEAGMDYEETLASIERSILEQALRKTGGNKKAAAEMLRLKRTTLSAKVRSLAAAS